MEVGTLLRNKLKWAEKRNAEVELMINAEFIKILIKIYHEFVFISKLSGLAKTKCLLYGRRSRLY